ncbi:mitochondrial ribonuclease P catalytic subunit [Aricia agestis]|uniref:mitochondrial ribonuclease P catalytic subunit n=1 Tax=Aricia agestis TaxID=91739 RepID=UPI001C202C45|nr:mitochondrial ribonuclease P catalytic subunit [Aricia agestis]
MNYVPRIVLFSRRTYRKTSCLWYGTQFVQKENSIEQVEYIKSITENNTFDWDEIKKNVTSIPGKFNQKNIDAVILKIAVNTKKFAAAQSFVDHITKNESDLSLGVINGLLHYYAEYSNVNALSKEEQKFILKLYHQLYHKYKFLDYTTCENLIQALCSINEWQKSIKVLDDIFLSSTPSHNAFSMIVGTLFRNNKKVEAMKLIDRSLSNRRPLLTSAYEEWINYIMRKYKDKKTKLKHLNEICSHLINNSLVLPEEAAGILKNTFISLDWMADYSSVHIRSGECSACKKTLNLLKLSDIEFEELQKNIKDKLIVGKDLFLKTSPEELKRFLDFINKTAPYDIVLDALNISYSRGVVSVNERLHAVNSVTDYFVRKNKKVLLLGRKHMLKWRSNIAQTLSKKALTFFTEDISQDDPYFITAAVLSGPNTDILSKDLLRNHQFILRDDTLRRLFQRWQWQHQWMMFMPKRTPIIQPPLSFTPCAQKSSKGWHLPYERKNADVQLRPVTGVSDNMGWLCLLPKS